MRARAAFLMILPFKNPVRFAYMLLHGSPEKKGGRGEARMTNGSHFIHLRELAFGNIGSALSLTSLLDQVVGRVALQ